MHYTDDSLYPENMTAADHHRGAVWADVAAGRRC